MNTATHRMLNEKQLLYLKCWYHECTSRVISTDFAFTLWNTSTQFSSENYQSSF
ncbi:hypothetical protein OIU79_029468, partial [Salix purpurea]